MNPLKTLFSKKEKPITCYLEFWDWFHEHDREFLKAVMHRKANEKNFFSKLSLKLEQLKDGINFLTGMIDENTAELVLTADGNAKNIAFVEELVAAAPPIKGWKFTALKPAARLSELSLEMDGYKFNEHNMSFYSNEHSDYPDEIDIVMVHNDLNDDNYLDISNGIFIYLDNYLGELDFVVNIDNITVTGPRESDRELIPVSKLKDFLIWRQKEFIEKYDDIRHNTENDSYSAIEGTLKNGQPLIAIVNKDLLDWDNKASHPWIMKATFRYSTPNTNGLPDKQMFQFLTGLEKEIIEELKDIDGYLNVGRQTADYNKEVYFACRDFRKPSKVMHRMKKEYCNKVEIDFEIVKDKYWQTFEKFRN
ncbi:MAG: DUF695 domain-containing protein [Chitinophagaceae bacterium]|nr:MAG: DUF695 domain-containing protein [Chitinophagaceae bacterium]